MSIIGIISDDSNDHIFVKRCLFSLNAKEVYLFNVTYRMFSRLQFSVRKPSKCPVIGCIICKSIRSNNLFIWKRAINLSTLDVKKKVYVLRLISNIFHKRLY